MGFADDLADLGTSSATWFQVTARGDYGDVTLDAGTALSNVRLVREHRRVKDREGEEVVSTAHLWVLETPAPAIAPDDVILFPDGSRPAILTVERYPDELGDEFTKVFFA